MIQAETYNIVVLEKTQILKLNLLMKAYVTYVCLETYVSNDICSV